VTRPRASFGSCPCLAPRFRNASRYNESDAVDARYTFGTVRLDGSKGHLELDLEGNLTLKPLGQPSRVLDYPSISDQRVDPVCLPPSAQPTRGTTAPCLAKVDRISANGTCLGVVPERAAKAAVAPAAWPIPMHEACTRSAEFASRSLLTHRPATSRFLLPFGINARSGTVGTTPS
jgi:hypothetical protein